jgi:hypothetical protein
MIASLGFTDSPTSRPAQINDNGSAMPEQGAPDRYGTLHQKTKISF